MRLLITYQYRAISKDGVKVRGVVDATDEYSAVEKIKKTSPVVINIKAINERQNILSMEIGHKKIDTKALSIMCSQFSTILKSGVPIATCMEMIAEQTGDKTLKKMLSKSAEDVAEGSSVATSFEKNCKGLPLTFIETVRAGEFSGTLENSFATLEKYYDKSYKNSQKVRKALSYPIFIVCVAIVVMMIVMVKVIPSISASFSELGGEMPGITKALISVSSFFADHGFKIVAVISVIIIGLKFAFKTENGRLFWNKLKLKAPVIGKISILNGASQFSNTMSALLSAGMTVHQSLEITSKVLSNYILSLETAKMTDGIEEGKTLGDCIKKSKYYPKTLKEMCALGEETGSLEDTLDTVGAFFDNETDNVTSKAIGRLEPTILILMALFAGFIVIAVYLPMFTIYNSI